MKTQCLACQSEFQVKEALLLGEVVSCSECGADFEVVGVNPFKIGELPEIEEDWGE